VKDNILEESGYFWWSDVAVAQNQFAPDSSVVGKLTIDQEGRIRLELDGVLPNKHRPMAAFAADGTSLPVDKASPCIGSRKCRFQILAIDLAEIFECRQEGFRGRCATNKINVIRVSTISIRLPMHV
jgi:hypothetical protein